MHLPITAVVHGESGVGKSWLADSCPKPLLVLDAEGGSRFTPSRKIAWDPKNPPPEYDGSWDTCAVLTRDFGTVRTVFQWLQSGKHPFKALALDSLTEIQKRCKDSISGTETPTERDWGTLLIQMESLIRQFRDMTMHPVQPLEAVVFLALTIEKNGKWRPNLQGQISISLPQYVDMVGYLYLDRPGESEEQTENGTVRRLLIQPLDNFVAKDRTHILGQHYGNTISDPSFENMLEVLNPTQEKE